ncbi:MAG: hypothetical protein D3910_18005 [Candidatus Electrothrix sp. ATG2]|nr:hypothetical protein [Candidatus Electrothrix sp. ATG2]
MDEKVFAENEAGLGDYRDRDLLCRAEVVAGFTSREGSDKINSCHGMTLRLPVEPPLPCLPVCVLQISVFITTEYLHLLFQAMMFYF